MAATGTRVTVGNTPTALNVADSDTSFVVLRCRTAATSVDVGGSTVTTGAGFELSTAEELRLQLQAGEVLFAVHAVGGARVDVLRTSIG